MDKLTKPFGDILSRRLKILSELNSLAIFKITAIHNQVSPSHRLPKAPREDIIHNTFDGEIIPHPHTSRLQLRIEQHRRELPEEAINLEEVINHAIVEVLLPALDLMNNRQRKAVLSALHRCDLNEGKRTVSV